MSPRIGVGYLELIVDLRAQDRHAAWGFDPQLHALAVDGEDRYRDVFTDKEALLAFSAQNEHAYSASVLTCAIVWVVV
ncbi:MAG TPA: hypothetical protein VKV73_23030 [Chloroflexota bacterium]|nr:hypothetical protein [Chloroflexota bacterium]